MRRDLVQQRGWIARQDFPDGVALGQIMPGPLALYPFLERRVAGDKREHHVRDRPRNAPARTAVGMAGVTFYGLLWLLGSNDLIASFLNIQLYWTTWFGRVAIFAGPVNAYLVTKLICLGLQRKDGDLLEHGADTHHQPPAQRRVHRENPPRRRGRPRRPHQPDRPARAHRATPGRRPRRGAAPGRPPSHGQAPRTAVSHLPRGSPARQR